MMKVSHITIGKTWSKKEKEDFLILNLSLMVAF